MGKRLTWTLFLSGLIIFAAGCTTLRYNMVFPEAKNFHPARIGVFAVDVGSYADAQGKVDEAIIAALSKEKKITRVVSLGSLSGKELEKNIEFYREKLAKLNYSDPKLSREIADLAQVDALIAVTLDHWDYLKEGDSKIAKVGLGIKMVDPRTGQLVWEARHFVTEKYLFVKPDLSGVAKKLMKKMAAYMPK
ncbi:MAG: hypothetical protein LBV07_04740 [Syntrophobacterales bacterium]|jgi:hypothetical protein|nr:hypothetical protein [Syntrophobacterales bacterium]